MKVDKIEAGPMEILHRKDVFVHKISVQPAQKDIPMESQKVEIINIDSLLIEIVLHKGAMGIFKVELRYNDYIESTLACDPLNDELPPEA